MKKNLRTEVTGFRAIPVTAFLKIIARVDIWTLFSKNKFQICGFLIFTNSL